MFAVGRGAGLIVWGLACKRGHTLLCVGREPYVRLQVTKRCAADLVHQALDGALTQHAPLQV